MTAVKTGLCPHVFGSAQCGATGVPCDKTMATCSAPDRFAGLPEVFVIPMGDIEYDPETGGVIKVEIEPGATATLRRAPPPELWNFPSDRRFFVEKPIPQARPYYWTDDVFDRRLNELRRYCMADVLIEKYLHMDFAETELRVLLRLLYGYPVATPKYRLKAPYGRELEKTSGTCISIIWKGQDGDLYEGYYPTRQQADFAAGMCAGWGCPSFILPKIADALFASGRYDCIVTVSRLALQNLQNAMGVLSFNVHIVEESKDGYRNDSDRDFR